ncbi:MAG: hypothetical protein O2821_04805 [Chloroflexi bacterium]|nr:hypothetical protein [Chloroflexota bacterium]MDA1227902.1 hypothetical protein [Chloroflexota bacterium]
MTEEATVPNASLFTTREAVTRPLNPLDPVRCTVMNSPDRSNRACTLAGLTGINSYPISVIQATRVGMSVRGCGSAAAVSSGNRVIALASAQPRSGPGSWEITHLYVSQDGEEHVSSLLNAISQAAIAQRCHRVFLRLLREDPLVDIARQSGFFPRIPETLYAGSPATSDSNDSRTNGCDPMTEETQVDSHDLFRLYNAATPSEVRYAVGMTMDQWLSSRERANRRSSAYVMRRQDLAIGYLRTSRSFSKSWLEASAHPDHLRCMPFMLRVGLEKLRSSQLTYCMLPDYQVDLRCILVDSEFQEVSHYITLVNTMTVKAIDEIRHRAAVPSI